MKQERKNYITQRALASKLGVSIPTIKNYYERGIIEAQDRFGWFILFDPVESAIALRDYGLTEHVRTAAERYLLTQTA